MPAGNTIIRKMVFSGHPFVSIVPFLRPDVLLRSYVSTSRRRKPFSRGMWRKSGPPSCVRLKEEAEVTATKEIMDRRIRHAEFRLTHRGDKNRRLTAYSAASNRKRPWFPNVELRTRGKAPVLFATQQIEQLFKRIPLSRSCTSPII